MKALRATLALATLATLALCAAAQTPAPADDDDATEAAPAPRKERRATSARSQLRYGVDDLRLELGHFPQAQEADVQGSFTGSAYVLWQPDRQWEWRAGVRVDALGQGGGSASFERIRADLGETYVRWRSGQTRLTAGAQAIVWGRVDEVPLIDRVSRTDLTRFALDDLSARRRTVGALRWEQGFDDVKLDVVAMPAFRGAELPDPQSVWSVVDQRRGRVIGIDGDPAFSAFVRAARIDDEQRTQGSGGAALRLTRTGVPPLDMGLTIARTRQSLPYYQADFASLRLVEIHPYQNFVGIDGEFVAADVTWRAELGSTDQLPLTGTDGSLRFGRSRDAVAAAEFFPGGRDLRVSLQLVAHDVDVDAPVLERTRYVGLNGEVQATVGQGRWRLGLRFASGLNAHDVYLGPKVTYLGWEPHEIYVAAHHFAGDERSLGGFHRDHGLLAVGLRTRF